MLTKKKKKIPGLLSSAPIVSKQHWSTKKKIYRMLTFYNRRYSILFPQTTALWNQLPRGCFPDHYNLNLELTVTFHSCLHKLLQCNPLPRMASGSCKRWTLLCIKKCASCILSRERNRSTIVAIASILHINGWGNTPKVWF